MLPPPAPGRVAAAFGIAVPEEPFEEVTLGSADAWRIRSDGRAYFLKRMRRVLDDEWIAWTTDAMAFERDALAAGVAVPVPVEPAEAWLGSATLIDGVPYRLYAWLDGRQARPDDDLATWLGASLARLHAVRPSGPPQHWLYGLHPMSDWRGWCDEGMTSGRPWAVPLADALGVIASRSVEIRTALEEANDFVMTHRDVEPWNVMITARGPLLMDLDGAGPDSATLELNHAALQFATWGREEPDWDVLGRILAAYGHVRPIASPFARRIGMKLNRLTWNLFVSLGHRPHLADKAEAASRAAVDSLAELPGLLASLEEWSPPYAELTART